MSKHEYDLAKAKKFLKKVGLSKKYSVTLRTNKSQGRHYALIQTEGGHTKTVAKSYNIDELMSYITAENTIFNKAWIQTNNIQPNNSVNVASSNSIYDNLPNIKHAVKTQSENDPELIKCNAMFKGIKRDLATGILMTLKHDSISTNYQDDGYIIQQIEKHLRLSTIETLKKLSAVNKFDYFDNINDVFKTVIQGLKRRGQKVYEFEPPEYKDDDESMQVKYITTSREEYLKLKEEIV